jgi:hypothetical protein
MVVIAPGSAGAAGDNAQVPKAGARVRVHLNRGRLGTREGVALHVRSFEGVSQGRVIAVRWDDDGCVTSLVPGTDIEVMDAIPASRLPPGNAEVRHARTGKCREVPRDAPSSGPAKATDPLPPIEPPIPAPEPPFPYPEPREPRPPAPPPHPEPT